jgi:hypothetical protein
MTLQPLRSGFPYIRGKFYYLFYQCSHPFYGLGFGSLFGAGVVSLRIACISLR